MPFLAKTWKFIKPVLLNKYLIVLLGFAVFITFFDQHNLIQRWETHRKIRQLEKEYKYYQDEITNDKLEMQKLQNDDQYLEKFAREHYHMKNKDEEIFIIKD
ncbi:MAG: septum formation initiator family protein [Bacteroidales bacterium]|nr:septum formation initiator family protein [Bacteroidales bacterium]